MKICVLKETAKIIGKGLKNMAKVLGMIVGTIIAMLCTIVVVIHLFDGKIERSGMWMVYCGYITWVGIIIWSIYDCYKEAQVKCELQEVRKSIKANRVRLNNELDELNKRRK